MKNSQAKKNNENDEEKVQKIFDEAIEAAKSAKIDIMKIFRAVVVRYALQLKNNPDKEITIVDVKRFYDMATKEMEENPDFD